MKNFMNSLDEQGLDMNMSELQHTAGDQTIVIFFNKGITDNIINNVCIIVPGYCTYTT